MQARWFWIALLSLSVAWSAEAQKKKKPDPKPPEPPKRVCQDGNPAAEDGSCPEDFVRACQDGNPAFEDGTCPEDAPKITYQEIPIEVKSNIELAVITVDDLEVGQVPFKGSSRISEGPHVFSVIFPGFNLVSEEIEVNTDLARRGIVKVVTLEPTNEKAKSMLSTPKGIEKFIVSGLTVDGFLEYQQAKKVRNGGILVLSASALFFGGFTAMKITFEDQQDSPLIATALTFGVVSAIVGAPATAYGQYKLKKSSTQLRDEEFRRKPPAPPEPPEEPASKPASAPSTAPATPVTLPTTPPVP